MRRSKVTAAIIAKNEEKNIKGCIETVLGWADEVVVVDGCSTDKTAPIARSLGARVIEHAWEGNFAKERNIANENSRCDWVLHIDADDRVTDEFKKRVDEVLDSDKTVDVYKFKRKSFFLDHFMEYGGWYHYVPNLVRRGRVRFEGDLHERPSYSGKLGTIEADIEHYPFDSISQFIERHNRYSTIQAARIFKENGAFRMSEVKKNLLGKSFKTFWKIYVKKKGRREGIHGLIFAMLFAFMNFMVWAKYWELCDKEKRGREGGSIRE